MTTETKRRIRAYKKALPELRERVIAVALLLAMSVSMLASASFAWITLSAAPEASGMQTTVAANGNLEIALAQGSISEAAVAPSESLVGDSSAAEGQTIVGANVTWGNLVNVSDPTYGLEKIALRPAMLSNFNRTEYPLNGATYGGDGRVVTTNDRYEYASYEKLAGTGDYYFAAGADASGKSLVNYGVRAISSVGYVNLTGNDRLTRYYDDTNMLYQVAQNYYGQIVANEKNDVNTLNAAAGVTCISALEGLVTVFAQDKINQMGHGPDGDAGTTSKTSCSPYLWYIYQMMLRLEKVLSDEGIALLELVNWQAYVHSGDDKIEKKVSTVNELLAMTETQWRNDLGLTESTISTIKSYKIDLDDLQFCIYGGTRNGKAYDGIKPMAEKCSNPNAPEEVYYWKDIEVYINILVDINTATLAGKTLSSINGISDALAIIGGGDVIVYGGTLKNIETRLVNQSNRVKAKVTVSVYTDVIIARNPKIKGVVYTDVGKAGTEPTYAEAFAEASGLVSTAKGEATAKDTYGMAIDLWVRTNYPNAVLTLEGSAVYEDRKATITIEGQTYDLYTITVGEEDAKVDLDVYQKDGKWYYTSNNAEVTETNISPKEKYTPVVVGYEGENRIWEDWRDLLEGGYIEQDATTQGAGSCFVFYANTPTEQAKIKEMLQAFNVAFIDQAGDILGTAQLNLESAYENQGKVTVPLEVITGEDYTDESGTDRKGITRLTQNTPKMITAIVYLNGSKLQNENVLAEGELQGQLNIQFGTDSTLIAPDNEELQAQSRTITAAVTVNGTTVTNDTIGGTEGLEYKAEGYKATVNLNIDGDQPERIKGFFVRVINATQGTRGEEKTFTRNEDGTWTAEFTLTNPGTYVFDTLLVDGVQYTLHDGTEQSGLNTYYEANRPKVHIKGLKVNSVSVLDIEPGTHMLADPSLEFPVEVRIDSAVPVKQVSAQFFNEDNTKQYTAIMTYDSANQKWVGSANISSSDTYTLKYISVDGQILDAPSTGTYTLYLGLRASVATTLSPGSWEFNYTGPSQITMQASIFDDSGDPITNLEGVQLYYNNVLSPASMTWNGKLYQGVLDIVQPGELTFQKLELGNVGTIRSASNAPRFLAINLETPKYDEHQTSSSQTVIGKTEPAEMEVVLKDAGTAQNVWAEIWHEGDSEPLFVPANENSGNTRSFNLPMEDGIYTLKRVYLQTVYDKEWVNASGEMEGKWYGNTNKAPENDADSTFMILTATDNPTTEVFASYTVKVTIGSEERSYKSTDNKSVETVTVNLTPNGAGTFLSDRGTGDITVEITDYKGNLINTVSETNSVLEIKHDQTTTQKYGYYTGAKGDTIKFDNLAVSNGKITFSTMTLNHAGEYNTGTFKVNIGGSVVDIKVQPKFTISSAKPTVTITDVTPDGTYSVDTNTTGTVKDTSNTTNLGQVETGTDCDGNPEYENRYTHTWTTNAAHKTGHESTISADGLTATVYFRCVHSDDATYAGGTNTTSTSASNERYHAYRSDSINGAPTVTLTLNGISGFSSATLDIRDTTRIYTGVTYTGSGLASNGTWETTGGGATYTWTSGGTNVTRNIGYMKSQKSRWSDETNATGTKTPAGTITADKLIVVHQGITYTFSIPMITINNPY